MDWSTGQRHSVKAGGWGCWRLKACRIDLLRGMILQGGVGTSIVIGIDVIGNATAKFFWATKFVDVDELGFEAAEPTLDHDIIRPAGLSVHALPDMK